MPEPSDPSLISYRASLRVCGHVVLAFGVFEILLGLLIGLTGVLGGLGLIDPHDTLEERLGGGIVALVMGVLLLAVGALNITTGVGLRRIRPWAKTLGLVTAVVDVVAGCGCVLMWALCIWLIVLLVDKRAEVTFAESLTSP